MAKITEWCPYCEKEVKLEPIMHELQRCPKCGTPIRACSMCDEDIVNCEECEKKYCEYHPTLRDICEPEWWLHKKQKNK